MIHLLPAYFQNMSSLSFFFNDTAPPEIYTLSLHDALPILLVLRNGFTVTGESACASPENFDAEIGRKNRARSEEHTSELQSQSNLVCRLLLEKKKKKKIPHITSQKQTTR